jgi:hypothetical protein
MCNIAVDIDNHIDYHWSFWPESEMNFDYVYYTVVLRSENAGERYVNNPGMIS